MFFFQEGFTYRNFLMDVLSIFLFIVWFWLLIIVFSDLFRRHDISGWTNSHLPSLCRRGGPRSYWDFDFKNMTWITYVVWPAPVGVRGWGVGAGLGTTG